MDQFRRARRRGHRRSGSARAASAPGMASGGRAPLAAWALRSAVPSGIGPAHVIAWRSWRISGAKGDRWRHARAGWMACRETVEDISHCNRRGHHATSLVFGLTNRREPAVGRAAATPLRTAPSMVAGQPVAVHAPASERPAKAVDDSGLIGAVPGRAAKVARRSLVTTESTRRAPATAGEAGGPKRHDGGPDQLSQAGWPQPNRRPPTTDTARYWWPVRSQAGRRRCSPVPCTGWANGDPAMTSPAPTPADRTRRWTSTMADGSEFPPAGLRPHRTAVQAPRSSRLFVAEAPPPPRRPRGRRPVSTTPPSRHPRPDSVTASTRTPVAGPPRPGRGQRDGPARGRRGACRRAGPGSIRCRGPTRWDQQRRS